MQYTYPVDLRRQEDGTILVTFPDVAGAVTDGATQEEALAEAVDCLIAALGGHVEARRDIPRPTRPKRRQPVIALPPQASAKLALYQGMRDAGLSGVALGRRLGITEAAVRRLIDLDHRSHIGQLEQALNVLGKTLVIEIRDAA